MTLEDLLMKAAQVTDRAYAPYSRFRVGAALETEDGEVFTGVNVENRSFGLTNCAERTALFSAVATGQTRFKALAVYAPDGKVPTPPCGACRQVLSEFMPPEGRIIFGRSSDDYETSTLGEIFPYFGLEDMREE